MSETCPPAGGDDPVVERVRAARREIVAECGGDLHTLHEWAKKIEAECPERIVGYETDRPAASSPRLSSPKSGRSSRKGKAE